MVIQESKQPKLKSKNLDDFYSSKQFRHLQETKNIHLMADSDVREMFNFKKYASDF